MQKSNWREEIKNPEQLDEFIGGLATAAVKGVDVARKVGKAISGREKTASQKKIIKTGGIKAARDMDGDGKLEKKRSGGDFSETLLYDVVHNYIIAENFASDTESANKVMLKLSDELMQEIYERTMTASEKRKDTMLKKKYDDSDMKKNMQGQYGKEEGKKVYFATIRKQAMKKEEVVPEEVGIATHSMMMKDKAKKEAMLRKKERDAVIKKLRKEEIGMKDYLLQRNKAYDKKMDSLLYNKKSDKKKPDNLTKEEVKRDEYGDPVGGPKISKKQKEKNLKANTPDEQHTTTTAEGYGSDRVGTALKVARVIDRVNPRPKPNSKRTAMSRALKMASIKKDEKIRKRKENPYSADKKLKMVASSIRDRVKRKVKSMAANEDYIPEEGYDQIKDRIAMAGGDPSSPKKMDATKYPVSKEIKNQKGKTVLQKQSEKKYGKGKSALDIVKADIRKKHGKGAIMSTKK